MVESRRIDAGPRRASRHAFAAVCDPKLVLFDGLWSHEPRLDPFRDAVWELSRAGHVDAYLTMSVIPMRSFPFFWVKREWLWFQVNWRDGRRDPPGEDYGPGWFSASTGTRPAVDTRFGSSNATDVRVRV